MGELSKNEKVVIVLVVSIACINFYLQYNAKKKLDEIKELIKNK